MSKEILMVVEAVSNEKGVDKESIFEAIEAALASATRKRHGGDPEIRVSVDRKTGEYQTFRRWEVLADDAEIEAPDRQVLLQEAQAREADVQVGDHLEEPMESIAFGRIAAQTARQVIVQKVREAERARVVDAYQDRKGELVTGVVKRVERGNIFLDLGGNVEAMVPREQTIPREAVRTGDRLRGYLYDVRSEPRGPQLFVSRTAPAFLVELFKIEVPEIGQELIELVSAARDPGSRAKVAVKSNEPRLDPVGACVGMRGSRVQAVSNELAGERVDVVLWDENPAQFVINAMAPAEIAAIVVDEDAHSMDVAVEEDQLSLAIGRGGQNVRLASELSGWELNIMTVEQAQERSESEAATVRNLFVEQLNVDEEVAAVLVEEGFTSLEEIAYVPVAEMYEIEAFDEDIVDELRNRARDALLTQAIVAEEQAGSVQPSEDLLEVEGVDQELAQALARQGVADREALAELAVDDLLGLDGMNEERAAELIMAARAHWFANEGQG